MVFYRFTRKIRKGMTREIEQHYQREIRELKRLKLSLKGRRTELAKLSARGINRLRHSEFLYLKRLELRVALLSQKVSLEARKIRQLAENLKVSSPQVTPTQPHVTRMEATNTSQSPASPTPSPPLVPIQPSQLSAGPLEALSPEPSVTPPPPGPTPTHPRASPGPEPYSPPSPTYYPDGIIPPLRITKQRDDHRSTFVVTPAPDKEKKAPTAKPEDKPTSPASPASTIPAEDPDYKPDDEERTDTASETEVDVTTVSAPESPKRRRKQRSPVQKKRRRTQPPTTRRNAHSLLASLLNREDAPQVPVSQETPNQPTIDLTKDTPDTPRYQSPYLKSIPRPLPQTTSLTSYPQPPPRGTPLGAGRPATVTVLRPIAPRPFPEPVDPRTLPQRYNQNTAPQYNPNPDPRLYSHYPQQIDGGLNAPTQHYFNPQPHPQTWTPIHATYQHTPVASPWYQPDSYERQQPPAPHPVQVQAAAKAMLKAQLRRIALREEKRLNRPAYQPPTSTTTSLRPTVAPQRQEDTHTNTARHPGESQTTQQRCEPYRPFPHQPPRTLILNKWPSQVTYDPQQPAKERPNEFLFHQAHLPIKSDALPPPEAIFRLSRDGHTYQIECGTNPGVAYKPHEPLPIAADDEDSIVIPSMRIPRHKPIVLQTSPYDTATSLMKIHPILETASTTTSFI